VLSVQYTDGVITYVCGTDPATARASRDIPEATVFLSPEQALAFRERLARQEGTFAIQYTVHEWTPEGYVFPV